MTSICKGVCVNLSDIVKKGMCILNKTTHRWASFILQNTHSRTLRHTFHHILTLGHSVFTDYSSMKQQHVLSVPDCGALDIDCQGKADVSERGEAGRVVEGSGRSARWSADSTSPDIYNCLLMSSHSCAQNNGMLALCWFLLVKKGDAGCINV